MPQKQTFTTSIIYVQPIVFFLFIFSLWETHLRLLLVPLDAEQTMVLVQMTSQKISRRNILTFFLAVAYKFSAKNSPYKLHF